MKYTGGQAVVLACWLGRQIEFRMCKYKQIFVHTHVAHVYTFYLSMYACTYQIRICVLFVLERVRVTHDKHALLMDRTHHRERVSPPPIDVDSTNCMHFERNLREQSLPSQQIAYTFCPLVIYDIYYMNARIQICH